MKSTRSVLLAVSVMAVSCGISGNGIDGAGSTGPDDGESYDGPVGYITVTVKKGSGGRNVGQPTVDSFRVVARRITTVSEVDELGDPVTKEVEAVRKVGDASIGGTLTLAVPAGAGYVVDVLTYDADPTAGKNYMVHYGRSSPFTVDAGQNSTASVTLALLPPTLTPPAAPDWTAAGSELVIAVASGMPLRDGFYFKQQATPFSAPITGTSADWFTGNTVRLPTTATATCNASPPAGVPPCGYPAYLQGQFFIHDSMLSLTEASLANEWQKWVHNYPYVDVVTAVMPLGQVSVTVTLPP